MSTAFNKTKIVATIGPATRSKEKILELIHAGVNVFRLNFSHDIHEEHAKVINWVNEFNSKFGHSIAVLQDLQGPKIRIGDIEGGAVDIKEGEELVITNNPIVGNAQRVSTTYSNIVKDVKAGDNIMIDDGNLQVRVKEVKGNEIVTEVTYGGKLKSKKGMNLPDTDISESSLTAKDRRDLDFGLEVDVNWVALSFVRTAQDIEYVKDLIKERGSNAKVIAKIERPEAIKNFDAILRAADGIMVARGDLGVEIKMEDVPMIQKEIIRKCNQAAKPVIVATQMMESMIGNPRPTRAEANDVANAVLDGADAVMLSAESAAGKFPVETVQAMVKIITAVERSTDSIYHRNYEFNPEHDTYTGNLIVESASDISEKMHAKAFVGMTDSGFTGFRISRHRPKANIYIFSTDQHLACTLNLAWGVKAFFYQPKEGQGTMDTFYELAEVLKEKGLLEKGDVYINIAGAPIGRKEKVKTNMMKVSVVR
ncbi:pyruvate kinase [Limibacter armeniacum]|uniref:pyruvate kinase n=1 Tax=Limibacter armeniacum TaxID=466084 RepID=UPI002FE52E81